MGLSVVEEKGPVGQATDIRLEPRLATQATKDEMSKIRRDCLLFPRLFGEFKS